MIVYIDSTLFESENNFGEIDRVFDLFISGRYFGKVDNPLIEDSKWFQGARQAKRTLVKELIVM